MNDLDLAKKTINLGLRSDIDEIEVKISNSNLIAVKIEKDSLKKSQINEDRGLSVRVIKNKSVGFSYTTSLTMPAIENCIRNAVKMAKFGVPDPGFHSLCTPQKIKLIKNTRDKSIAEMEIEEAVSIVFETLENTKIDKRIYNTSISFNSEEFKLTIANSRGIELDDEPSHTGINVSAEVTAKENDEMTSGFEFQTCRFLKELNPSWIGKEAAKMAINSLNAKKIETTELPVILHPLTVQKIVSHGVGDAINAESILYKRSFLVGKKNQKIGNEQFSVIDDGTYIKDKIPALFTSSFDGEGHPHGKTQLVENGILKNYLHNSYTSKRMEETNTGNASRGTYRSVPSISSTNLIVKQGTGTLEDMINDSKEAILLIYTGDSPNLATGDFSALISSGYKIKNGEIDFPLKQAMLGINLMNLFERIEWIGKYSRQIGHVFTPAIKIERARIGGQ
ncbi:MAG: TldD/PmbA family protein [Candidatus Lokiarchaeota archaeon]|nr:TldD/PmbA family protein [Candidatus Lokiarchaeota archaeon]